MQKKIIALALAGMSSVAFAQSNVTISGLFDAGLVRTTGDTGTATNDQSWNAGFNNTGTSQITVAAREDLGGGMRAGVVLETDIRGSTTQGSAATVAASAGSAASFGGFQHYLYLGKAGLGEISFGQRTNMTTTSLVTMQPFGTAMGGGDGGGFTRTRGGGFDAYGVYVLTGRDLRPEGAMHVRSDNFSGFSLGLDFKPKNSAANEAIASSGYTGFGLNYNNGPLNLTFANSKVTNMIAGFTASNTKNTALGGNYAFGPMTVYAGWTRSKADTVLATAGLESDSASWNIGLKYVMGAWAFSGNYVKDNDKLAADVDRKLLGLGVDYSMSKRTTAYGRYTSQDQDLSAATGNGVGKLTQLAFGLKHTF